MTQIDILNSGFAVGLVTAILGLLKPVLESLGGPFAKSSGGHDATFRILNVALQLAVIIGLAASNGEFDLVRLWPVYLATAIAQGLGSHALYRITRSTPEDATIADAVDTLAATLPAFGSVQVNPTIDPPVAAGAPAASATSTSTSNAAGAAATVAVTSTPAAA